MNPPEIHLFATKLPNVPAFATITITGETAENPLRMSAGQLRLLAQQCHAVADKLATADKAAATLKPPGKIGQS